MRNPLMRILLLPAIQAFILALASWGQETDVAKAVPPAADFFGQQPATAPAKLTQQEPGAADSSAGNSARGSVGGPAMMSRGAESRFSYYMRETWLNPSLFTAPAFSASIRMAHPPGKGTTRYPDEWRQRADGFGRNYGDAFAIRISTHTAQFLTAALTRENPHYIPSANGNFFARSSHALAFIFVDRSDSGRPMPALSNFAGAAAGGFVGNAYLPDGFRDVTHAGQRASFQFGMLAAGNLFREFAPQMPAALRGFISLLAR